MFIETFLLVEARTSDPCSRNVKITRQVNMKLRLAPSNLNLRQLNRFLLFWIMSITGIWEFWDLNGQMLWLCAI